MILISYYYSVIDNIYLTNNDHYIFFKIENKLLSSYILVNLFN